MKFSKAEKKAKKQLKKFDFKYNPVENEYGFTVVDKNGEDADKRSIQYIPASNSIQISKNGQEIGLNLNELKAIKKMIKAHKKAYEKDHEAEVEYDEEYSEDEDYDDEYGEDYDDDYDSDYEMD